MYEKHPEFACSECHKSFKNKRALEAHNDVKHGEPDEEAKRLVGDHMPSPVDGR